MPPLITADDLRTWFEINPDIGDPRLTMPINAASRRLKKWVGDANYADSDIAEDLQFAEAHLAMHFALLGINTVLKAHGVVEEERVEDAVTVRYLSPAKIAELSRLYFEQAEELTRDYLLTDGTPSAPFGVVTNADDFS